MFGIGRIKIFDVYVDFSFISKLIYPIFFGDGFGIGYGDAEDSGDFIYGAIGFGHET